MKRIYLDNSATSFPKPKEVGTAMLEYIECIGTNVGRGAYQSAYQADSLVFEARERVQKLFNADDSKNVLFTMNVTQSLNQLIKGLLTEGDHVLVSSLEHNAVMRPLEQMKKRGVTYSQIPCDEEGRTDILAIPSLICQNTRAIIMLHASNVCGTIQPIKEVGEICAEKQLIFIVDVAQTAGCVEIDMKAMNIDALAFTGHKSMMGPQGIGGFVISDTLASQLEVLISGGTGSLSHELEMPEFLPDRFEAGTPNIPGIVGLNAALGYIEKVGLGNIRHQELALTMRFIRGLESMDGVKIIGPKTMENRTAVVSILIESMDMAMVAHELDRRYGIMTRVGIHCSPCAHQALGTYPAGTIRFSFGHFNTTDDVTAALHALKEIFNNHKRTD